MSRLVLLILMALALALVGPRVTHATALTDGGGILTPFVTPIPSSEPSPIKTLAPPTMERTGSLLGNSGGAKQNYLITLPADKDVTFTLTQGGPCLGVDQFGLKLYQGVNIPIAPEVGACTRVLTYKSLTGGKATLEIYNYENNRTVNFTLRNDSVLVTATAE